MAVKLYEVELQSKNDKVDDQGLSLAYKCIYTLINLTINLFWGLSLSSFGPAFVDLKHVMNTTMEWIGLFPSFQAIGCIVGSFFGFSYNHLNRQIVLGTTVLLMGMSTILIPYSTDLWHLYICIFIYGIGIGVYNPTNNVIMIELWEQKSPSILQFSQCVWGIGLIIGPLLVRPYLLGETEDMDQFSLQNSTETEKYDSILENVERNIDRRAILKIPFLIGGLMQMIAPTVLFLMYFIRRYPQQYYSDKKIVETQDRNDSNICSQIPKTAILVCISLFLAFTIMSENMYMDFSSTFFQFCPLRLTAGKAAEIVSTMSIALAVGRGLSVFIAAYLRPQYMIGYQLVIVFIGFIFQYFSQNQLILLWSSAVIICFGYSSIFICLFSFVGQYMAITDRIGALFAGSYNFVYLFLPFFLGRYIEEYPDSFLYIEFGSLCVGILIFITVLFFVRNVPKNQLRKLGPMSGH